MRLLLILLVGIIAAVSSNNVPILRKQLDEALDKVADLTRQLNGIIGILEDTPASCTQQCPNYPLIDMNQVVEVTGLTVLRRAASNDGLVSLDFAASSALCLGRCLGSMTTCRFAVYDAGTKACQGVNTPESYITAGAITQSILVQTAKQFHRLPGTSATSIYSTGIALANPVLDVGTEEKCRNLCAIHPICLAAVFEISTGHCFLKSRLERTTPYNGYVTFVQTNAAKSAVL